MNWEIGIDVYTLICIKQITDKSLLYSTGNSKNKKDSLLINTLVGAESKPSERKSRDILNCCTMMVDVSKEASEAFCCEA